eukprot:c13978_g1_i1.p1 GENE.c13978_g1_i1~~c13978_g1_i1.p1  ORF type:complete len:252 (-),score=53.83 c13978_g1_i1:34-789(-)
MASGKSSSWFFFTSDMRFAIKTCTRKDFNCLLRILESYMAHCKEKTLLPKYLGLYTIILNGQHNTFVVMNNVFASYLDIHERYDLKGSTYGRRASKRERLKPHCVLKDLDFKANMKSRPLQVGDEVHHMIRNDAKWLAAVGLMDYSLLMGLHLKHAKEHEPIPEAQIKLCEDVHSRKAHQGVVYVETDEYVAFIGIIDILTNYSTKKRFETLFTGKMVCHDVSCQHPKIYGKRFAHFLLSNTSAGSVHLRG